jgi:hypothetical protein
MDTSADTQAQPQGRFFPVRAGGRLSRLAAALAALGLVAGGAWTLSSGFCDLASQISSNRKQVELSLPYRGFCGGVKVQEGGRELPLEYQDVQAGLARFSLPLTLGKHELVLHFQTIIPGWEHEYALTVTVDQTPPPLKMAKSPLLSSPASATVEESLRLQGQSEPGARLLVDDRELALDGEGAFSQKLALRPGWNNILIRAEDAAGNRTSKKLSIFRDIKAPEIAWNTAPGQAFQQPQARLELSVSDDGQLAALSGKVDGQPVTWHRKPDDRWLGITESLPEGRHQVELKAADRAGRVATSRREFLIDSSETLGQADLVLGARGADVVELHKRLRAAGYLKSDPGTTFTALTRQAIEALQAHEGYPVTGTADRQTLAALGPRIYINLSRFELVLERPGQPDRRYQVAAGAADFPTPTGRFSVYEKVRDPSWLPPKSDWARDAKPVDPGPNNPLGSRWIGLDWGGVGIHGTNAPWTVGSAASHGCLRMETSQVEELFSMVEVGTPVVILAGSENDPILDKYWPKG